MLYAVWFGVQYVRPYIRTSLSMITLNEGRVGTTTE